MYAFKVFVSTLVLIMVLIVTYAGLVAPKKQKTTAIIMDIIYALCLIAIWGKI